MSVAPPSVVGDLIGCLIDGGEDQMTTIDCDTCPVRGRHCGDCFVPVLAGTRTQDLPSPTTSRGGAGRVPPEAAERLPLDRAEVAAVGAFVRAGLITPAASGAVYAERVRSAWSEAG